MQPDDEHARLKEKERGHLARQIFDNPLWGEAYVSLIDTSLETMLARETTDDETLELKRRILAMHDVKRRFERVMQTGDLANQQLEAARDGAERTRRAR